jgi:hypothetical protein
MEYGSYFLGATLAESKVFTVTIMFGRNTDKQEARDSDYWPLNPVSQNLSPFLKSLSSLTTSRRLPRIGMG